VKKTDETYLGYQITAPLYFTIFLGKPLYFLNKE
jgi:hypothetical protein